MLPPRDPYLVLQGGGGTALGAGGPPAEVCRGRQGEGRDPGKENRKKSSCINVQSIKVLPPPLELNGHRNFF